MKYAWSAVALSLAACQSTPDAVPHMHVDPWIDVSIQEAIELEPDPTDAVLIADGLGAEQQQLLQLQRVWQARISVALENISNLDTPGYKRRIVRTTHHPGIREAAYSAGDVHEAPVTRRGGTAVLAAAQPVFTPGSLQITERPLDLAIDGDGFFELTAFDGSPVYTRDGSFHINRDGVLCSGSGLILQPQITLPGDLLDINIDSEGRVAGRTASSPDTTTVFGQLQIHRFVNPCGLRELPHNHWMQTDASGTPTVGAPGRNGLGWLMQGFIERSNVQIQEELVRLHTARKQYRALARVLGIDPDRPREPTDPSRLPRQTQSEPPKPAQVTASER